MADNRWIEDDYRRDDRRSWTERTSDEVRSWFGDDEARMRRGNDERDDRYPYGGDRTWRDSGDGSYERAGGASNWRGARDLGGYEGARSGWSEGDRSYGDYSRGDSGRGAGARERQPYGSHDYPRNEWDRDREQLRRTYSDWTPGAASGARDWKAHEANRGWATRVGVQRGQSSGWGRVSFAGRGPKGYRRSDERIREDVADALTDDPLVDASEISIAVEGGNVTLTGTVIAREQKRRAEDVAERVSGVNDVTNHLRVAKQDYTTPDERRDVSRRVTPSVVTPEGRTR